MDYYRIRKIIRILIACLILTVLLCDVTYTKDNKYFKINNMISVLTMKKGLIEKGTIEDEN